MRPAHETRLIIIPLLRFLLSEQGPLARGDDFSLQTYPPHLRAVLLPVLAKARGLQHEEIINFLYDVLFPVLEQYTPNTSTTASVPAPSVTDEDKVARAMRALARD